MKPETLERRIYIKKKKEGENYLEKTSPITHPTTYSSLRLQKKGYHSTHVCGVSLLSPFEVDPRPSGVVTIYSHCQVLIISAGWQNVQSLIHSVKIDLISESSFAKSTLKRKRNSIVKCISLNKILTCSDKEQSLCHLHQLLLFCHSAEAKHARSDNVEASFD